MSRELLQARLALAVALLISVSAFPAAAQAPFTNQPVPAFLQIPVAFGSAAWGDYDNDGRLDLLLIGTTNVAVSPGQLEYGFVQLWHNDGNGQFHLVSIPAPGVLAGTVAWVDYDNDGYLDFMIAGEPDDASSPVVLLYHNQHDGTFTNVPIPGLVSSIVPGQFWGTPLFSWGDYDHDGRPDLAIMSSSTNPPLGLLQVWHNDGGGAFSQVPLSLTIPYGSTVQWADMDNDGWIDLVVAGAATNGGSVFPVEIFHNNFTNNAYPLFTPVTSFLLGPNASTPRTFSLAIADYNNDGLLDLVAGIGLQSGGNASASLEFNVGQNQYTNNGTMLPASFGKQFFAAGDYDNDGLPDLAEMGFSSGGFEGLLLNNGNDSFSTNALPGLPEGGQPFVTFADYDNDGRLDLITMSGASPPQLWHNQTPLTNTPPTAPTGLSAIPFTNGVQLSWNPATDAQTPSPGLSYNLRVGTVPGTDNYIAAEADLSTGWRRVVQRGVIQGTNYELTQMPPGIYFWSVQAIDSAFAGGPFAAEGAFAIPGLAITPAYSDNITASSAVLYSSVSSGGTPATGFFQWGLTTSYGNRTAAQSLGSSIGTVPFHQGIAGLQPATYYHFRAVVTNAATTVYTPDTVLYTDPAILIGDLTGSGQISASEAATVLSNYFISSGLVLTNPASLGGGNFQFGLGAISGWSFNVQASSDLTTWSNLPTSA
ncbi:MAG TPA: VCBS repeat-containing protein, partial [Candidatus Acidoferrum sp.]|nr:VCBS repeat-containing protein [Candidatus Acidoferrum sp.]